MDDFASARLAWRSARRDAKAGLGELKSGNVEMASVFLLETATAFNIAALEFLEWSRRTTMRSARAQSSGGHAAVDRDRRFAAAVAEQEANGVIGKAGRGLGL